jgi:hypothetical protein
MFRKLRKWRGRTGAFLLLFSLFFSLLVHSSVSAATPYDDIIKVDSTMTLNGVDISNDWYARMRTGVLAAPSDTGLQTAWAGFQTALNNDTGWAVLKCPDATCGGGGYLQLVVTDPASHYSFQTQSSTSYHFLTVPTTNSYLITMRIDNNGNPVVGVGAAAVGEYISGYLGYRVYSNASINTHVFYINAPVDYPIGYEGERAPALHDDNDGDGLITAKEIIQGTSDTQTDTDGDGLNDLKESIWNPDRDTLFCKSDMSACAYPDPAKKDLYVEVDWMKESGLLGRSFKPSETQLSMVKDAYSAHGINAHFDTGQYGGGNELPIYTQNLSFYITPTETDFYDYKYGDSAMSANFESERYRVWHYLISGYRYIQDPASSGASYVGDDDSFVSTGYIQDSTSFPHVYDTDHAVAGTILHELGHSLCLSSQQEYINQSSECIYAGIHTLDDSDYDSYHSVMNYSYQMTDLVNLSSGLTTPNDHDDWSAIKDNMGDFTSSNAEGVDPASQNNRLMLPNSRMLIDRVPRITS